MQSFSQKIYNILIQFYPNEFQQQHGLEMQQTFADMEKDFGQLKTWAKVLPDFFVSVITINLKNIMEKSSLQYKLGVWGIILIAPFLLLLLITFIGMPLGYSTNKLVAFSPKLSFTIIILLPALAFLLNLFPILQNMGKADIYGGVFTLKFVKANILSLAVACAGIGIIALMILHDPVPCFVNGLIRQHFHNIVPLFEQCKNA